MSTGKSKAVSTSYSTYAFRNPKQVTLGLQWLELRALNKLAYLPKDPRVAIFTDGDATKLHI